MTAPPPAAVPGRRDRPAGTSMPLVTLPVVTEPDGEPRQAPEPPEAPPSPSRGSRFGGRAIVETGFAGDDGSADPALAAVLEAYQRAAATDADVLAVLAGARLLVPMAALPGPTETGADGLVREKESDLALPLMVGTDGRRALPAFTSVAALAAWDPAARPVPVDARRAAAGALQEGCAFLVVDPAGPATWVADRAEVEGLAAGSG